MLALPARCEPANIALFCPTGQTDFVKSKKAQCRQGRGYCAWGCFRSFVLLAETGLATKLLRIVVMAGLDPAIHDFCRGKNVDARDEPGHDGGSR
ncbi:hypothetical protein HZZ16_19495 [Bradyrhizobium sp. CNPSo 4016]|nr:hypothetical protein [Bradyrhizobium glycinis]